MKWWRTILVVRCVVINPMDREHGGLQSTGSQELDTTWQLKHHHHEQLGSPQHPWAYIQVGGRHKMNKISKYNVWDNGVHGNKKKGLEVGIWDSRNFRSTGREGPCGWTVKAKRKREWCPQGCLGKNTGYRGIGTTGALRQGCPQLPRRKEATAAGQGQASSGSETDVPGLPG